MRTEDTLSSAWDQHLASEFAAKSPEQALATMTAAPYVNLVALMIGARGRVVFLASDDSIYVTGTELFVDGGFAQV